jgi:hypothetical protein
MSHVGNGSQRFTHGDEQKSDALKLFYLFETARDNGARIKSQLFVEFFDSKSVVRDVFASTQRLLTILVDASDQIPSIGVVKSNHVLNQRCDGLLGSGFFFVTTATCGSWKIPLIIPKGTLPSMGATTRKHVIQYPIVNAFIDYELVERCLCSPTRQGC